MRHPYRFEPGTGFVIVFYKRDGSGAEFMGQHYTYDGKEYLARSPHMNSAVVFKFEDEARACLAGYGRKWEWKEFQIYVEPATEEHIVNVTLASPETLARRQAAYNKWGSMNKQEDGHG